MKILTVSIRENETIIGQFKKKKNDFSVIDFLREKEILTLLLEKKVHELSEYFKFIVTSLGCENATVYITLPSHLIRQDFWLAEKRTDTFDKVMLVTWADKIFQQDIAQEYAIGFPRIQKYNKKTYVSVAATSKEYIATLYKAFEMVEIDLAAIEAESVAFIRCVNKWTKNYIYIDIAQNYTNLIHYCSKIGMYTVSIPIGQTQIAESENNISQLIMEIQACKVMWTFEDKESIQYYASKEVKEILSDIKDEISTFSLPRFYNSNTFQTAKLVLPIGSIMRELKGDGLNEDANHEFSVDSSRDEAKISTTKNKIKKSFDVIKRYLPRFNRR